MGRPLRWFYELRERVTVLLTRSRREVELDEELRFHVEMETERIMRDHGLDRAEARRQALSAFGGLDKHKEEVREAFGLGWVETTARDAHVAVRSLFRNPRFACVAVVTIALGIGSTSAMFSVVNGILLRPLVYADPGSLVQLHQASPEQGLEYAHFSPVDFDDWERRSRSFTAMAAFNEFPRVLTGGGDSAEVVGASVSARFFDILGAPVQLGRSLLEADAHQRSQNVVISDRLWRAQFAGDPDVLGRVVGLTGLPHTVVGVMPAGFNYPNAETELWAPLSVLTPYDVGPRERSNRYLTGVARLAPGVIPAQAEAELTAVSGQLAAEFPESNTGWTDANVVPLRTTVVGDVDRALLVLLGVVGFTLLLACANLANLLLARGTARTREIALRAALGAGRGRLVRQLLTESLVLAGIGGGVGLVLSTWGVDAILAISADTLPRVDEIRVDGRVIGFGLLSTVVTGMAFGLLPAWRTARSSSHARLGGARGTVEGGDRLRSGLVVAEVALAVVLVIGAGLMARSFIELQRVDAGFDPDQVLTVSVHLNLQRDVEAGEAARHLVESREAIVARVGALPGVIAAGTINQFPLRGEAGPVFEFRRADGVGPPDGTTLRTDLRYVHPDYFAAMGIPLIRGDPLPATFGEIERRETRTLPMLISETTARRYWPGEDPVGRTVSFVGWTDATVTGIVGDARQHGLAEEPSPAVYFPQIIAPRILATLAVRAAGDPRLLVEPIRRIIREVDPNQSIRNVATLSDVMAESIAQERFFTLLFGIFGGLAIALAAVGIYGVLVYIVSRRTQEIGVRMALGAQASAVLRATVGWAMWLVGGGAVIGIGAALGLSRVLESQLYGIRPTDPVTFVAALAFFLTVALLATYFPARRASRVDPIVALRAE